MWLLVVFVSYSNYCAFNLFHCGKLQSLALRLINLIVRCDRQPLIHAWKLLSAIFSVFLVESCDCFSNEKASIMKPASFCKWRLLCYWIVSALHANHSCQIVNKNELRIMLQVGNMLEDINLLLYFNLSKYITYKYKLMM